MDTHTPSLLSWEVVCTFVPKALFPSALCFLPGGWIFMLFYEDFGRADAQPFDLLFLDLSFLLKTIVPMTRHFGYAGVVVCRIL